MSDDPVFADLPIFYKNPVPLTPLRHAGLRLAPTDGFAFAREATLVPLNLAEFASAAKHYPIVFTASAPAVPLAILGIEGSGNLFVDEKGQWAERVYIPAYCRRYPFLFLESEDRRTLTLCVDEGCGRVGAEGEPLFVGQDPSPLTVRALEFCRAYQAEYLATQDFGRAIEEAGLLKPRRAEILFPNGKPLTIDGFRAMEESDIAKLPEKLLAVFHRKNWLGPIYWHLLSTTNWADLVARA